MKDIKRYLRRIEGIFDSAYSDGYTAGFNKAEDGTYIADSKYEYMCDCVAWMPLPEPYRG